MIKVYGITNCDTIKKARAWLESHGVQYEFHDFKKQGITQEKLKQWCAKFGWEKVLNKSGMMWRKTSEEEKAKVVDETTAIQFMIQVPNSIKRPVVEYDGEILLGFDEEEFAKALSH
jgi:arsenate reductase